MDERIMNKRMNYKIILCLIGMLVMLSGCYAGNQDEQSAETSEDEVSADELWLPEVKSENEIMLYDYYEQKFVTYDVKEKKEVSKNELDNFFQYCFNVNSDLYTSGHSMSGQFEILKLDGDKLEEVYKLEDTKNEKIYPCAADVERGLYYFVEYFDAEETERKVVQYKDGALQEFTNTSGYIMPGTLVDDCLYYTLWSEENESYDIYTLDINDYDCEPKLFQEGVENCDLFYCDSKMYAMSNSEIYNIDDKNEKYERKDYNYFDRTNHVLIQISPGSDSGLELLVTDLATGKEEVAAANPISYQVENGNIVIYCPGEIVNYKIES